MVWKTILEIFGQLLQVTESDLSYHLHMYRPVIHTYILSYILIQTFIIISLAFDLSPQYLDCELRWGPNYKIMPLRQAKVTRNNIQMHWFMCFPSNLQNIMKMTTAPFLVRSLSPFSAMIFPLFMKRPSLMLSAPSSLSFGFCTVFSQCLLAWPLIVPASV